jgi:hypothetical protein
MRRGRLRRRLLRELLKKELIRIDPALEEMPDSFTPAYVLLVQQHVRRRFVRSMRAVLTLRVWVVPWRILDVFLRAGQLAVTNLMVASYLNESALRGAMEASRASADRDPQA